MECVALPNYMVFEAPSPGPNLPPTDASPLGHPQDARLGFLANGLIGQGKTFTYFPLPVLTGAPIRPLKANIEMTKKAALNNSNKTQNKITTNSQRSENRQTTP